MIWGNGFRDSSQQRGSLRPRTRRVAVLGVGAPLPLRESGGVNPGNFLGFLMPNPAFWGNLGQKIRVRRDLPERFSVSVPFVANDNCRSAFPAPKYLPERRSTAFPHHYIPGSQRRLRSTQQSRLSTGVNAAGDAGDTSPQYFGWGDVNGNISPNIITFRYSRPILVALRSLSLKLISFGYKTPPIRFSQAGGQSAHEACPPNLELALTPLRLRPGRNRICPRP